MEEARKKKNKGPSFLTDLVAGPNKAFARGAEAKDRASLDMAGTTLYSASEAPEEGEEGVATIANILARAGKALVPVDV